MVELWLTSTSARSVVTTELPSGWDPRTGLGMPPEIFNILSQDQSFLGGAPTLANQGTSASQPTAQNISASQPMSHETHISQLVDHMVIPRQAPLASQLIGPMTAEEARPYVMKILYPCGATFVYYDPALGALRHINVPQTQRTT